MENALITAGCSFQALAVSRRRVETRDTEMARQMDSVDTEVGALIKREKLELLKGRVVQLRKETGKPAPRGKKRVLPQTEKEITNMMAQVRGEGVRGLGVCGSEVRGMWVRGSVGQRSQRSVGQRS